MPNPICVRQFAALGSAEYTHVERADGADVEEDRSAHVERADGAGAAGKNSL